MDINISGIEEKTKLNIKKGSWEFCFEPSLNALYDDDVKYDAYSKDGWDLECVKQNDKKHHLSSHILVKNMLYCEVINLVDYIVKHGSTDIQYEWEWFDKRDSSNQFILDKASELHDNGYVQVEKNNILDKLYYSAPDALIVNNKLKRFTIVEYGYWLTELKENIRTATQSYVQSTTYYVVGRKENNSVLLLNNSEFRQEYNLATKYNKQEAITMATENNLKVFELKTEYKLQECE